VNRSHLLSRHFAILSMSVSSRLHPLGYVTTVLVTDQRLDGPPAKEFCGLTGLRELDLDGGNQCGPFPEWVISCLPQLQELDLSFNRVRERQSGRRGAGSYPAGPSCLNHAELSRFLL
jgi:hypothetical protein